MYEVGELLAHRGDPIGAGRYHASPHLSCVAHHRDTIQVSRSVTAWEPRKYTKNTLFYVKLEQISLGYGDRAEFKSRPSSEDTEFL